MKVYLSPRVSVRIKVRHSMWYMVNTEHKGTSIFVLANSVLEHVLKRGVNPSLDSVFDSYLSSKF